ncbi:helix-turn-helix domain-containing protein [Streptomyces sp. NPDC096030]|uniref:helix-turn-helix domain-containing protein n=1 Tax=Streptomyces sp. NPDC096030 TaxID=3155423 RepID=UPI003324AEA6
MTINEQTETAPLPRRRRADVGPLPSPEERHRLRRMWRLSERQVAEAFGVTVATVRSWESGRTSPTGRRRQAYAAFLRGLAQALDAAAIAARTARQPASPVGAPAADRGLGDHAAMVIHRPRVPGKRSPSAPSLSPSPAPARTAVRPVRGPAVTGSPVGAPADPVPTTRRRRWRLAAAAADVWTATLHLLLTSPPPHP